MKKYSIVCYRGKLNGRNVLLDLIIIEFPENKKTPFMFNYQLSAFLYEKRGKTKELGPKNGPGTAGWLEVSSLLHSPDAYPYSRIIQVDSFIIPRVYEKIKPYLKIAIDQKIKIIKTERRKKHVWV